MDRNTKSTSDIFFKIKRQMTFVITILEEGGSEKGEQGLNNETSGKITR